MLTSIVKHVWKFQKERNGVRVVKLEEDLCLPEQFRSFFPRAIQP